MAHPDDCLVTQKLILTYYTRILLLDLTYGRMCTSVGMYVEPM